VIDPIAPRARRDAGSRETTQIPPRSGDRNKQSIEDPDNASLLVVEFYSGTPGHAPEDRTTTSSMKLANTT